jgi:hypothetical protein
MRPSSPQQSIDLAGLKISAETFDKLTFFYNIADGFESLSSVADLALREWLTQQGAAIRMHQIDVRFIADQQPEEEIKPETAQGLANKAGKKSHSLGANITCIDTAARFCLE